MIEWMKGNSFVSIVTLYPNNFTLNTYAGMHFTNVRYCMIGIDKENRHVAIKPVPKEELDLKIIPFDQLHKVSVGKGYVRISNKSVLTEIAHLLNIELNGVKFGAHYDEQKDMLVIDLNEQL